MWTDLWIVRWPPAKRESSSKTHHYIILFVRPPHSKPGMEISRLHIWFDFEKMPQKVSQRLTVVSGVLNNILKVYQNLTMQKV